MHNCTSKNWPDGDCCHPLTPEEVAMEAKYCAWVDEHHPEFWKEQEYRQEVLSIRESVNYNPFEVFQPSKTFLRDVVKQLKQQCYGLMEEKRRVAQLEPEWLFKDTMDNLDKQHKSLIRRIKTYEFRIKTGGKGAETEHGITEAHRLQAKSFPVQDFYTGNLRKAGKTLVGKCPFHNEKTGSFTIYTDKNRFICFGCGEKGDSIDFVSKKENLNFIEAIKYILKI